MRYRVQVKEINYGTVIVEANSAEEAIEKAEGPYAMGDIIWSRGEYELSNAEVLPKSRISRIFLRNKDK